MSGQILMQIHKICKDFGPTHANHDIDLTIQRGDIRGLAGENGSGKSTLASIICGIQQPTSGSMEKDGKVYAPKTPIEASESFKVSMVVQELGVIPTLTGAANIFLGKTKQFEKAGLIDTKAMQQAAQEIFDRWELGRTPLHVPASMLSIEQRKMLELARALSADPDLLILDEITQALSHDTKQIIYRLKERFRRENRAMLIITHDLEETVAICDTVTVLRDGEIVDTVSAGSITVDDLKQMMIGRKAEGDYYRVDTAPEYREDVVLEVRDLTAADQTISKISFDLHKDEILAICGLSDGGIHDLGEAIFGIKARTGSVVCKTEGRTVPLHAPKDVIGTKGAYLSKNRDEEGLMLNATVYQNLMIPSARRAAGPLGYLSRGKLRSLTADIYKRFDIKAAGLDQVIGRLSGGNKQKVNLGRWLAQDLDYCILDCPTRGVDVGVKAYIYEVLKELKADHVAIIMISDELKEAIGMADRILVMKNGEQKTIIERGDGFTESKIIEVMA